jgi:hypothetical protein
VENFPNFDEFLFTLISDYSDKPMGQRHTYMKRCLVEQESFLHAYTFFLEGLGEIQLCHNATAHVFSLKTRQDREQVLCSVSEVRKQCDLYKQSSVLQALALYHANPHTNFYGYNRANVNWSSPCFNNLEMSNKALSDYCNKHGLTMKKVVGHLCHCVPRNPECKTILDSLGGAVVSVPHELLRHIQQNTKKYGAGWEKVHKNSVKLDTDGRVEFKKLEGENTEGVINGNKWYQQASAGIKEQARMLDQLLTKEVNSLTQSEKPVSMRVACLRSKKHNPQSTHVDFEWKILEEYGGNLTLGFAPVTIHGMFLQVWSKPGPGTLLYIPLGSFLILPGKTKHAGGFLSGDSPGNLRLHYYFYSNGYAPIVQINNIYTDEMGNYLSDTYVDAVGLEEGGVLSDWFKKTSSS